MLPDWSRSVKERVGWRAGGRHSARKEQSESLPLSLSLPLVPGRSRVMTMGDTATPRPLKERKKGHKTTREVGRKQEKVARLARERSSRRGPISPLKEGILEGMMPV